MSYRSPDDEPIPLRVPVFSLPTTTTSGKDASRIPDPAGDAVEDDSSFFDENLIGPSFYTLPRRMPPAATVGSPPPPTTGVLQYLRAARGRLGRGGRLIFDLIVDKPQDSAQYIPG